jgi:hypothetical protein
MKFLIKLRNLFKNLACLNKLSLFSPGISGGWI